MTAITLLVAGCSAPTLGQDHSDVGKRKVVELVNEAGAALPTHADLGNDTRPGPIIRLGYEAVTAAGVERENCYKKFLGYSLGPSGLIRPELRTIVYLPLSEDPVALLALVERRWNDLGYATDTSRLRDSRYPQIQARAGEYRVYATALAEAAGFGQSPRLTIYAVAPCQQTIATR